MDVKNSEVISSSEIVLSKYSLFRNTCLPQIFSFPKSIIEYVWLNPKSPKTYLKTIKSCKLLFLKNPILIIPILRYTESEGWKYSLNNQMETEYNGLHEIYLHKIESKIWITDSLRIFRSSPKNIASNIFQKIFRCEISILQLENQKITFNQFKFFTASIVDEITLYSVTVERKNGEIILIDELLDSLPNVAIFMFWFPDNYPILPSESIKKLAYSCCTKFQKFTLSNIFEGFEIETFFHFLKEQKNRTFIDLSFQNDISEIYQNRIYAVISEIISTTNFDYLPPIIFFPDMNFEISFALSKIVENEKHKYY